MLDIRQKTWPSIKNLRSMPFLPLVNYLGGGGWASSKLDTSSAVSTFSSKKKTAHKRFRSHPGSGDGATSKQNRSWPGKEFTGPKLVWPEATGYGIYLWSFRTYRRKFRLTLPSNHTWYSSNWNGPSALSRHPHPYLQYLQLTTHKLLFLPHHRHKDRGDFLFHAFLPKKKEMSTNRFSVCGCPASSCQIRKRNAKCEIGRKRGIVSVLHQDSWD